MSPSDAEEPPQENPSPSPLLSLSSLPNDVVLNCLARVSRWDRPSLSLVSRSCRSLMASRELHATRSLLGLTERCFYFCLRIPFEPSPRWFALRPKPGNNRLVPIPSTTSKTLPLELPRYSSVVSLGSEIYVVGGVINNKVTSSVFLLDCRSHTWRRLPSSLNPRWGAAACAMDGKVYVIGGRDEPSSNFGEVFDPKTQTWEPLTSSHPKLGFQERCRLSLLTRGATIDGKVYGVVGTKCVSYEPKEGRLEAANEGMFDALRSSSYCVIENVLYSCDSDDILRWYDAGGMVGGEVKGVELPPKFSPFGEMANCGGNLAVLWKASKDGHFKPEIWCTEIALERRSREEVWGEVKFSNAVFTVDYPCFHVEILDCLVLNTV